MTVDLSSGETSAPTVHWIEDGVARTARWRSERGAAPPRTLRVVDDRLRADEAYGLACQGIGLLWRGDFHNARQLLTAMAARAARDRKGSAKAPTSPIERFNRMRQVRAQTARTLGMLLVPIDAEQHMALRRAPDQRAAQREAWGPSDEASLVSLREWLGVIGAHQWRVNGKAIAALDGARIHPHYGVFAPIRDEYVTLLARMPLPAAALEPQAVAFDIGTGTGVLAAVLVRRGLRQVIATDLDPRALACASDNLERLGLAPRVQLLATDLYPGGRAALVVCNPPWLPARPATPIEHGIYDADGRMLSGFLAGLRAHLEPGGEGWLVLSDLAEHLGLRTRAQLLSAFADAGLAVAGREDIRPTHPRASDRDDPLQAARAAEVTSIWRLVDAGSARATPAAQGGGPH